MDYEFPEPPPPRFAILGAAGDGKSSLIAKLLPPGVTPPESGGLKTGGGGVTKDITPYHVNGYNDETWVLLDTMGVGDATKGIATLVSGLQKVLSSSQVDGIIVTSNMLMERVTGTTSLQVLTQIIQNGLVNSDNGVSPWQRIILCGTKRDRCEYVEDEVKAYENAAMEWFEQNGIEAMPYQATTCSVKAPGGMDDLLGKVKAMLASLRSGGVKWDPEYEENGGHKRMAMGICEVIGGDARLTELEMIANSAWSKVLQERERAQLATRAAVQSGAALTVPEVLKRASDCIVEHAGRDFILKYQANAAAAGVGSYEIWEGGKKVAEIAMENAKEIGKWVLDNGGGTLISRGGNIPLDSMGLRLVNQSIAASGGSSIMFASTGASALVGGLGASPTQQKVAGLVTRVGVAAYQGGLAAGGAGAAGAALCAALTWTACEVMAKGVEAAASSAPSSAAEKAHERARLDVEEYKQQQITAS